MFQQPSILCKLVAFWFLLADLTCGLSVAQMYSNYKCRDDWMTKRRLSLEWVKRCVEYEERDINENYLSDKSKEGKHGQTVLHAAIEQNRCTVPQTGVNDYA